MTAHQRHYAALMVSLAAYAGLRLPEEVLSLEWRHIRDRTLLVEQRLIDDQLVPGQKVRHFRACRRPGGPAQAGPRGAPIAHGTA